MTCWRRSTEMSSRLEYRPSLLPVNTKGVPGPPKAIHVQDINDGGPCAISDGGGNSGHGPFSLTAF